ncbi:MAG: TonB-dependent receptor, partial [Blastocatellia bacterium]|nr:TonB-dependent receptor [Blastocatellia bacterium]
MVDELGAAIPNAEVNLIGSDGRQRTTKSNANGEFAFPNAPPGVYTLTSAYKGFQTHVQEGVKVPGVQLKVVMAVATVNEAVETKADEGVSVEPDQNMTATVLGEEFIENLPDNEDDLNDYLQALAGPAAGAASGGEGSAEILVDGFSGGHLPPREAIQQIKINNSPFSAEFQNPGYSRVEIITKPGFGDWRGGGGIGYRNANLDARNPFLDPKPESKPDFSQQRYNFNLGGPIIKKKVSFFMYGDRTRNSGDGISKAITLENTNPTLVPASSENIHFGLHNDYTLNDKNTLNLGYHYGSSKNLDPEFLYRFGGGFGGGVGGGNNLFLPERGTDSRNSYHSLRIGETWIISSNLINEMRMRYSRENSTTAARTPGLSINVLDSFFGGGGSYPSPSEARSDEIEVHNYLTLTHKRHTIKGGLQFTHLFNRDFNESNFLGTYTFANLNEYQTALANMGTPLARAQTFSISGGDPYLFYRRYTAGVFLQDDIRMSQRLTLSFGLRQEFQSQLRDKNNWSPRFGFAWSPFSSKTVFRGGAGLFYNLLSDGSYENTIRYNGLTQTNTIIRNALYPDPFAFDPTAAEEISSVTPTVYSLDPNLKAPYTINYNLSVEQQLPRGLVATISYIHVNGVHLFRLRNINAPFPGTDQRPNPAQGSIYDYESTGRSTFDGLFFRFQRRFSQRLTFFANYGLSWARSDTYGGLPANNYDLHSEWGRSSSDRRHNFSTIVNLNLPHGFRLNPIVNAYTGRPFNITTGVDD